ncbi:MAG TPA: PQQ-binding-like beta-propeller repeat protein [Tepidisphaeraceae bacterium]|nr:PQQ-binding-like beta-propeller repeat protein [Tepidisphaeraceae bacterium]
MRQHLWISLIVISTALGCASRRPPAMPGLIPGQSFVKQWQADLNLAKDPVKALYVRDNVVIAYTANNNSYWLSASGGQLIAINAIVNKAHRVYAPVGLAENIVIPTTVSIESYNKSGKHLDSFAVPTSVQSPAAGLGNALFLGVTRSGGGGRLARFNVDQKLSLGWDMYTANGLTAAPAVLNDTVFAGDRDGKVWALTSGRVALWALPGNAFQTDGPISADLAVDDNGVYVASEDKKLYCLDRTSGKIKWIYFAGYAMTAGPVITPKIVYQLVPNVGLVAINKTEGKFNREPLWIQPSAQQVLAMDEKYVYVRYGGTIAALDIANGQPVFESTRNDLQVFASDVKGSTIYASTRGGTILAIKPVLKPGTVGELVFVETVLRRAG